MKRRDFLKGLSAIVPASLLAKLALPKVEEPTIAHDEVYATEDVNNGVWFQNGGRSLADMESDIGAVKPFAYFINGRLEVDELGKKDGT